jgi:hypothetical protein
MKYETSLRIRFFFCIAIGDVTDFILGILRDVKTHCKKLNEKGFLQ